MQAIMILDGVADGLDRTSQTASDAPADLCECAAAYPRQTTSTAKNLFPLVLAHLRKAAAALDAVRVGLQKALHHRLQEANLPFAIGHDGLTHQAETAPATNRFRRDVELLADLVQRDDGFGKFLRG